MSCYEWETASITLPSTAVAPLKKVLRESNNALHEAVRAEAVRLHKSAKTTNLQKYAKAVGVDLLNNGVIAYGRQPSTVRAAAVAVLGRIVWKVQKGGAKLHVPTVADVNAVVPKMTTKDDTFRVINKYGSYEATITFNGRNVQWDVPENNHAVAAAHEADLAKVFFAHLDRIKWTRATGGYGVGNNEYHREDDYAGGGANYTTFHYGPLGEAQKAAEMGMSVTKYRQMRKAARSPYGRW